MIDFIDRPVRRDGEIALETERSCRVVVHGWHDAGHIANEGVVKILLAIYVKPAKVGLIRQVPERVDGVFDPGCLV